jgi:hypothetical protein
LHFWLVAIAEVSDKLTDMVGYNVFGMFFTVAPKLKQIGYFMRFIALCSYAVSMAGDNIFISERMGCFGFYIVKAAGLKLPGRFQLYRFVKCKVENLCIFRPGGGVFNNSGCLPEPATALILILAVELVMAICSSVNKCLGAGKFGAELDLVLFTAIIAG